MPWSLVLSSTLPRNRWHAHSRRTGSDSSREADVCSTVAFLEKGCADTEAPAPSAQRLLCEAAHCTKLDEGASGPVCLVPRCGKPTWNGRPNEYCSINCRDSMPHCKRPGCTNPTWNGKPHEYCSMPCKNASTLCLQPGCSKTTFNGHPHGFCSIACFDAAEPICLMHGCGKKTWNGRPAGYCSTECRDKSRTMLLTKGKTKKELAAQIDRIVSGKVASLTQEQEEAMDRVKETLTKAPSGKDLLLMADLHIDGNWLGDVEEVPGNIYRIAAFGRLYDPNKDEFRKTAPKVVGWVLTWLLQVGGPPAIFLSSLFGWGIKCESYKDWTKWEVNFQDWNHIGLTKILALLFQLTLILNALFVVQAEWDAWHKINTIIHYMLHINKEIQFRRRFILYVGIVTNCWVVLWCCLDTVVVLGFSDSPKDVVFDALGLLFIYNLDDVGSELGFIKESDWPGAKLGWIYSEMAAKGWHPEGEGDSEDEKLEIISQANHYTCGKCVANLLICLTVWMLRFAGVLFPTFSAITSFTELPPAGNSTCQELWRFEKLETLLSSDR